MYKASDFDDSSVIEIALTSHALFEQYDDTEPAIALDDGSCENVYPFVNKSIRR